MTTPHLGYTTRGRVVHVVDGDTVDLEIRKRVRVRLLQCWAPNLHGNQRVAGLAAREHLRELCGGQLVTLHIPGDEEGDLSSRFTFGRVLGFVYLEDNQSLSEKMVAAGHATRNKRR